MPQIRGPTGFYQVAQLILTNVETALAASLGGAVDRACVVPGDVAWDDCTCGLLAITLRRWFLTDNFPETSAAVFGANALRVTPCDLPWLVGELRLQVIRCAPTPPDGQLAPSCVDLDAAAQVLLSDAYVALTETVTTLCELRAADEIVDYIIGDQESQGPAGDCVGTELIVQIGLVR